MLLCFGFCTSGGQQALRAIRFGEVPSICCGGLEALPGPHHVTES